MGKPAGLKRKIDLPAATLALVQVVWDYHFLRQAEEPADILLVLCSNDLRVADHAAAMFRKGLAPLVVFSGGIAHHDDLLATGWDKPEARMLAGRAMLQGVPEDRILLEESATNTGENFTLTAALLASRNVSFSSALIVQKPFMLRRAYATGMMRWPDKKLAVTAQDTGLQDYIAGANISPDDIINIMVGDLQRIRLYPEKGYQIHQDIPAEVWDAYEQLVAAGYDRHLVRPP